MQEQQIAAMIEGYPQLMRDLELVRDHGPAQGFISAGYIRSFVWDLLHGYPARGLHTDIDVVYYDPSCLDERRDTEYEQKLFLATGDHRWSVKNQARMHIRNGEAPYTSLADALKRWPETATAIAARLDEAGAVHLCAPHGTADLFAMTVRRSPFFPNRLYYSDRLLSKNWQAEWPNLIIVDECEDGGFE